MNKNNLCWLVYIIEASDNSLYTGITTDIERRWREHRAKTGAKFFRGRSPVSVLYLECQESRSTASCREAEIKKLNRGAKQQLILSTQNQRKEFNLKLESG